MSITPITAPAKRSLRPFVLFLFAAFFFVPPAGAAQLTPDHAPWARLLEAYLAEGEGGAPNRFDYGALKANGEDRAALRAYIASLEAVVPDALPRNEAFAFWVNLYNALTVEVVVDHYPVASIRDIAISPGLFSTGPWGKKLATVAGRELSLDDIEHGILRPDFGDSRVHYAVNCASAGCPDLAASPYAGAELDAMLDSAARAYVNSPRGARVEGGKLTASGIFKWYMKDFGGTEEGVLAELRKYAGPDLAAALENVSGVASYDYDWSLNDAAEPENRR
ncbi:MAG: DUF547 domain-containing protein [Parvibaculum sp.]|jgi:hypothetical protein